MSAVKRGPPDLLVRHIHIKPADIISLALGREGAQPLVPRFLVPVVTLSRAGASKGLHPDAWSGLVEELFFTAAQVRRVASQRRRDVAAKRDMGLGQVLLDAKIHVALGDMVVPKSSCQSKESIL